MPRIARFKAWHLNSELIFLYKVNFKRNLLVILTLNSKSVYVRRELLNELQYEQTSDTKFLLIPVYYRVVFNARFMNTHLLKILNF